MIAYLDASVLLRVVFRQKDALSEWRSVSAGVSSALVEAECLRTLDRFRVRETPAGRELQRLQGALRDVLDSLTLVDLDRVVLRRAAQPLPVLLGTLDAIHLATALLYRESTDAPLTFATHDESLARAARAFAFPVVGA